MKTIIILIISFAPIILMAQPDKTYTIEGKANIPATLTLQYKADGKTIENTTMVNNGSFKLTGTINTKVSATLMIAPKKAGVMASVVRLWLEPGNIKVSNIDSIQKSMPVFSGTLLNDETNELSKAELLLNDIPYGKQQDSVREIIVTGFIKAHPNSLLSLTELDYTLSRGVPNLSVVEPLFNGLSAGIKASPAGLDYQQKLIKWKTVDVGSVAPDFTQPDQHGKPVKLSDFRGKYVFIDFWASWCHPCRDENPNLIKQYNLYKNKNFVILSVSLDGGMQDSKKRWLAAIKQDGVGIWPQVCDFTGDGKNNIARAKYGVGSIPESFLVNPDGKIIAKSLRGEELNKKLKEIFDTPDVSQSQGTAVGVAKSSAAMNAPSVPAIADNKVLPLDAAVRTGKLANGFTYYIRNNTTPKNSVTFYLVNKAGSILENEDQRGLAHLIEHMNFDGTTHFPKYELINYLQKSGVRFGADLNAYTGFDETVYQLPLPSNNPEVLKNGIQIMRDWAKGALLDSAEMMRERSVVLEEKRIGKGAGERMNRQYLPVLLNGSRYSERLPIGLDTVLNNFKPGTLREFYHDWYRPDLQALIVVGDINPDQMEAVIKEKFSDLKNPENEKNRVKYTVPLTGKNQFIAITDKDQSNTVAEVIIKHKSGELKTAADYRRAVTISLFNRMLGERIAALTSNKSDPPFTGASAGAGNIFGGLAAFSVVCVAKPGEIERGLKAVWLEVERVKHFGFTQTELNRAKMSFLTQKESSLAEIKNTGNDYFVNEYQQYFLNAVASPGIASEVEMTKAFLPGITLEIMQKLADEYIRNDNRDIVIMAPDKDKHDLPDENKIIQWIADVANGDIKPYKDSVNVQKLFSKEPAPGKILKEQKLEGIDATIWTLGNGAKVILKKTDFSASFILFRAFAPGGSSSYNDKDFESARNATYISFLSGVGNYTYGDFNKLVSGKDMFTSNAAVENYLTTLQGGASIKEIETYLQVLYTQFTEPRFDPESFKGFINSQKIAIANRSHDPKDMFMDTVQAVMSNHSIRTNEYTAATLAEVDLAKCKKIYDDLISGNVSNFTFIVSGPINLDNMRPLIEKNIASLPAGNNHMVLKNLGIHPPEGKITQKIYLGTEPKSTVNLTFSGSYSYNAANNKTLEALKEVIQISLLQRLREQENGAYSPYAAVSFEKIPDQRFRFKISFDCAPENSEKLVAATLDELDKIRNNGPDPESLEKFKAEDRRNQEMKLKEDFSWIEYIERQSLNQEDFNEVNDYDKILEKVTKASVKNAAIKYLSTSNLIQLVLKPETTKAK